MFKVALAGAATAAALWIGAATAQTGGRVELAPGFSVDAELLKKAQAEGKTSFWCSFPEPECAQTAADFEKLTKVKVDFVRLSTGGILTRISKERAAGIFSVDVISHGDPPVWEDIYKAKKWITPYVAEGMTKYPAEFKDPGGYYAAHWMIANGIGYNTKLVSQADLPKSYADLLKPRWKGQIVMPHPKHSGGFAEAVAILSGMLGWDFFEKLNKNAPLVTIGSQFNVKPVVLNGERQLAIHAADAIFLVDAAQGKPVGVVYPEEGTVVNQLFAGLVANAPQPNAGKLLLEWLHSAPMQTTLATHYWLVPHPDAVYPKDRVPLKDLKILTLPASEAASAASAKEKFSDIFGG
jgi:iron(III) transport system substrate-binding protein